MRLFVSLYQLNYFPGIRESACFLFGKNELAAVLNLKDSPIRLNQFGINAQFLLQFLRQTGGSGFVISHSAVRDFADIHVLLTSFESMPSVNMPHDDGPHNYIRTLST